MPSTTIHCSYTGSDTSGDGSAASPYRTPTYALRPPSAGGPEYREEVELLLQRGGIYPHLEVNRSGLSPERRFVIKAYGEGPDPILSSINFQNGGLGIRFTDLKNVSFVKASDSIREAIRWDAVIEDCSVDSCKINSPYDKALAVMTAAAGDQTTINSFRILNNVFKGMTGVGIYAANTGAGLKIIGNKITDIGESMFDQGIYMNANCTDYEIANNFLDNCANAGIQCRSRKHNVHDNLVIRCGFGIATGHGMSFTFGQGGIRNNVVCFGRSGTGDPLSCGIGAGQTRMDEGREYLISGNIVFDCLSEGPYGGISVGDDSAKAMTWEGQLTRGTHAVVVDNFVKDWGPALRVCENNPNIGISRNQFVTTQNHALLKLSNPAAWHNLGVIPFSEWLASSKIMQQNDWVSPNLQHNLHLSMDWMPGSPALLPSSWLPGLDPGCGEYPASQYNDVLNISNFLEVANLTKEAQAELLSLRIQNGSLSTEQVLAWARSQVGY